MNRITTLILMSLFINFGFSQVGSDYILKNDWEKYNLKGNVKFVKLALKNVNDKTWDKDLFIKYNPVFHNYHSKSEYDQNLFFRKFNKYGIMIEYSEKVLSNLNEEFGKGNIFKFEIDSIDFIDKLKIAKQYNFPFCISPNRTQTYDSKSKTIQKYEYKTEDKKIKEELYFDDYISDEFPKETSKFKCKTLFFYNINDQIIKKNIIIPDDEYNENSTETYYGQQIFNGNTLNVNYVYNETNQLVKITVHKKKKFIYQETYKIENNKIIELEKLVDSKQTHNEFDTNKIIYIYDDYGNVVNMICYDNEVGEEILISIHFEYTFDNTKNWILCKMYVNQKNEIPDAIVERKIEYFSE